MNPKNNGHGTKTLFLAVRLLSKSSCLLRIAQITDLHLGREGEHYMELDLRGRFLRVLEEAKANQPDLYAFTGDFSLNRPTQESVSWFKAQLTTLNAPYFVLAGNHDDRQMLRRTFHLKGAAKDSIDFVVHRRGQDLIVLDTSTGELQPSQLAWLQAQLGRGGQPVIFMHHPPLPLGTPFMDKNHGLRNYQPLLDILVTYQREIPIFCGHYHADLNATFQNLNIYVAPPTSFFINPKAEEFQQDDFSPAFQLIELTKGKTEVQSVYC